MRHLILDLVRMPKRLPELVAVPGLPPRRRLFVAIGGTLVLGTIAAAVAHEHAGEPQAAGPAFDVSPLLHEIPTPAAPPASPEPQASDHAVEALRDRVDQYLDARAAALTELDAARERGVDPAVLAAMAAALGVPPPPARSGASAPSVETSDVQADPPSEPRAL